MPPDSIHVWVERLQADFGLTPVVASEIEFYLTGAEPPAAFWQTFPALCAQENIRLLKHEKEKGQGQYEIALLPTDPGQCASDTALLKKMIEAVASKHSMQADFRAKPYEDEPGSGLHIHVHLEDASGKNVFFKQDDVISDALKCCIGGLLERMIADMPIFAPHEDSHLRFVERSNAPLTVSWGANNRTTALRLPDSAHDKKRIEHRVAGADADPAQVIAAILSAMHHGLMNEINPPPQIYGDAALPMYGLPRLTSSGPK